MLRRTRSVIFIISLVVVFCAIALFVFNIDRAAAFLVGRATDYNIMYGERSGSPFDVIYAGNLKVEAKDKSFSVFAENAELKMRWAESLDQKKLVFNCKLEGVNFYGDIAELDETASLDSLVMTPFRSKWRYRSINFEGTVDHKEIVVKGVRAVADGVKVEGDFEYATGTGDVETKMHMSFSPEVSETLLGGMKDMFLVPEKDGWYGLNMSVKGNTNSESFQIKSDTIDININRQ